MQIKVQNTIPGVKVSVNQTEDGVFSIQLTKENAMRLSEIEPGSEITLGGRKYIVLGHEYEMTAVIAKEHTSTMEFGNSGDYRTSKIRNYLNDEFYKELVKAVGKDNILKHTIDLEANDGTGKGISCTDMVSLLTTSLYRKYRKYLPAYGKWWWLLTRVSHDVSDYSRYVCDVGSDGILNWNRCDCSGAVRPFFYLNSSIFVDP